MNFEIYKTHTFYFVYILSNSHFIIYTTCCYNNKDYFLNYHFFTFAFVCLHSVLIKKSFKKILIDSNNKLLNFKIIIVLTVEKN